jgi:hypothetical protein
MKLTLQLIFILLSFRVYADVSTDMLFEKIQNELEIHQIDSLTKLETTQFSRLLDVDSGPSNFIPTTKEFLFECGLYIPAEEPQQILYTIEFVGEIEKWIPINGKSIITTYWNVFL